MRFLLHPSLPAVAAALPVGPVLPESPVRSQYLVALWDSRRFVSKKITKK